MLMLCSLERPSWVAPGMHATAEASLILLKTPAPVSVPEMALTP